MPDPLYYSPHAEQRFLDRCILERKVMETVICGVCIANYGNRAVYARGRMRVVVSCGVLVITAYRMRRLNPKRILKERRKRMEREWRRARGLI